jgi:hypothetical protein
MIAFMKDSFFYLNTMKITHSMLLSATLSLISAFPMAGEDTTGMVQGVTPLKEIAIADKEPGETADCALRQLEWSWSLEYFSRDHQASHAQFDFTWRDGVLQLEGLDADLSQVRVMVKVDDVTVFYGANEVPRRLALHHLRERVLGTPLLFDDLRSIYRFVSNCHQEFRVDPVFFKDSMIAYSNLKTHRLDEQISSDTMYSNQWRQYHYRWRQWKNWHFKSWLRTPVWRKNFPQIIEFTGQGDEWARLELVRLKVNFVKVKIPDP